MKKELKKAILVGLKLPDQDAFQTEMEELKELVKACDIEAIDVVTQNANCINNRTYIHKGKLYELKDLLDIYKCSIVVFNDELYPSQINNIKAILSTEEEITIYDRTYIILEIFNNRAKTKEAILQVEIASLRYLKARLIGLREGLSRQRGVGGSAHGKGSGETKLEIDRRNISDLIVAKKKELAELTKSRLIQRKKRTSSSTPVVCLVGYTNSGKSSMLNAMLSFSKGVKKEVMQEDMLFATLETSSRQIKLANGHSFVLTDTVGFINKLPTTLVEAFKSTLEEIKDADLIIHVVDCSNPEYENQIATTNKILREIGVDNVPTVYAFNKIDKVDGYFFIPSTYDNAIRTSTVTLKGLDTLIKKIEKEAFKITEPITVLIPYQDTKLINTIKEEGEIIETTYLEDGTFIKAKVNEKLKNMLTKYIYKEN